VAADLAVAAVVLAAVAVAVSR